MTIIIFLIIFLVLLSGFFSSMETAFLTSNPLKFYTRIEKNKKLENILALFKKLDTVINTILIGNTLVNISIGILLLLLFLKTYPFAEAVAFSTLISTPLILIFGEILPKSFSLKFSMQLILFFSPVLRLMILFLSPLSFLLKKISQLVVGEKNEEKFMSREEIEFLFHQENEKNSVENEKDFIRKAFLLSDVKIKEIMIPINQTILISNTAGKEDILDKIKNTFYSRLPVYENEIFNLIGYVAVKSFIFGDKKMIEEAIQTTVFFPETKTADKALFEMQKAGKPIAFVVDEYGAVSGIITKEDLAELIVGNLEDDLRPEDVIVRIPEGFIAPGGESIDELNEQFHLEVKKDGFETLSGFISYKLGKIPAAGDNFEYKNHLYIVVKTNHRIAERVKVIEKKQKQAKPASQK